MSDKCAACGLAGTHAYGCPNDKRYYQLPDDKADSGSAAALYAKLYHDEKAKVAKLERELAEAHQYRHGHLPSCAGSNDEEQRCDCGYLQGTAYRELAEELERLKATARTAATSIDRRGGSPACVLRTGCHLPAQCAVEDRCCHQSAPSAVGQRQIDKRVEIQASEHRQLLRDAGRYAWLRDNMRRMPMGEKGQRHFFDQPGTMSFQEAVDEAMETAPSHATSIGKEPGNG